MLQPRLENEKFNSLPNLLTSERSHAGFITTDRPDSSQFVDLHVYIIPKKVWKDVQHLAENDAMDDAISAGFVHVSPNMKLCDLRQSIEQSCGTENYFPRDFIFLRSVGRCLTRVKPKQEQELKVKNYRPPQTFAPEIYLLEGRHEDYAHIPSASPAFSSSSYVFGNRVRNRSSYEDDDDVQSPTKFMQNYNRKPMRGGNPYPPALQPTDSLPQFPSSSRQSWAKFTQIGSDPEESSAKELSKLKEEQERLRRRQAELERMRRAAEEKKARTAREEEDHRRPQQTLPDREDEERRRRQQQALADREEEERRRRQQQALADQEEEERRRRQQQALADREEEERRRRQQQALADREEEEERRRRQERAEAERRRLEQERAEAERRRLEQERAEAERRRLEQEEAAATKIQASFRGFKDRQAFRERKRRIERERREAESRRRRQLEEEEEQKRKAYELEEQRRTELAKRQREGPEALRARLQELRSRRADLERIREEVIRHLKNIHNRITLRRKDARDMWKKKYFTEKKKTPAFEGRILSLKDELDQIHKKTIHTIDNEFKHTGPIGYPKEAAVGSLMTQVTQTHHQIQDIRHQVEQAKLRLTTDLKLRNQAENECRSLRHELNQAKMNLNHIKTRVGP